MVKLKLSLRKHHGLLHNLLNRCGIFMSRMTTDMFRMSYVIPSIFLSSPITYNIKNSNTTGTTSGASIYYPSSSSLIFAWFFGGGFFCLVFFFFFFIVNDVCASQSLVFCVMYCLSFFDVRLLIIPLLYYNSFLLHYHSQ